MTALKRIDDNIRKIRGLSKNLNALVAATAVAIVEHAFGSGEGQGSGDVSRAQRLLKALPNSMNRTYLIRWFQCANIAINPNEDYSAKVVSKDSKAYRPPSERVDFAKSNNWFDAVDKDGNRAPWYQGPTPREQEPNTFEDFAGNIVSFADRTAKQLREGTLRNSDKPMYALTDEQRGLADKVLGSIKRLGIILEGAATREQVAAELASINETVEEGLEMVNAAPSYSEMTDTDDDAGETPTAASAAA